MIVINFFGGPGSGKSTTCAKLFVEMKMAGYSVELVTEYAKDMVWEGRHNILDDQIYMLAKQNRRLARLSDHVEYAITDTSILLGCVYGNYYEYTATLRKLIYEVYNSYNNINIFINRKHDYQQWGRRENDKESLEKSNEIKGLLELYEIPFIEIDSDDIDIQKLLKMIVDF